MPTGDPASLNLSKKGRDIAVTADPESTRKSTAWSPIQPSRNQWPFPDICIISSSGCWSSTDPDQSTDFLAGIVVTQYWSANWSASLADRSSFVTAGSISRDIPSSWSVCDPHVSVHVVDCGWVDMISIFFVGDDEVDVIWVDDSEAGWSA